MMRKEFEETYKDSYIVDRALELYGNKHLMGCKEEFNCVSLTNVLDLIRNKSNEYGLLIAVVGDKVEDTLLVEGSNDSISLKSYISQGSSNFVEKWKNKAKILNYHNHPNRISARPSIPDI